MWRACECVCLVRWHRRLNVSDSLSLWFGVWRTCDRCVRLSLWWWRHRRRPLPVSLSLLFSSVRPMLMSDIWHRRIGGNWTHRRSKGNGAPTADVPNLQRQVYEFYDVRSGCNWVQPDTGTLCARGGHKMQCMAAPVCGEGTSFRSLGSQASR